MIDDFDPFAFGEFPVRDPHSSAVRTLAALIAQRINQSDREFEGVTGAERDVERVVREEEETRHRIRRQFGEIESTGIFREALDLSGYLLMPRWERPQGRLIRNTIEQCLSVLPQPRSILS